MRNFREEISLALSRAREIVPGYLDVQALEEVVDPVCDLLHRLGQITEDEEFLLTAANAAVSALGQQASKGSLWVDGFLRWLAHQLINLWWASQRYSQLVLWVFPRGRAAEVSLFGDYREKVLERMEVGEWACHSLIIGIGPDTPVWKISVRLRPGIDWSRDQEFGWKDAYGVHKEFWDAGRRAYVRRSMSGRTRYTLLFNEEGYLKEVIAE